MVLKPEPIFNAVRDIRAKSGNHAPLVYLSPQGRKLTPALAAELAAYPQLIFLAGRYVNTDTIIEFSRSNSGLIDSPVETVSFPQDSIIIEIIMDGAR